MAKKMASFDRAGRVVIAAVLIFLALGTSVLSGALVWVALAVAAIFTLTAVLGNCPIYSILGLKTCRDC